MQVYVGLLLGIFLFSILIFPITQNVSAQSINNHLVSMSSGEKQFGPAIIRLDYKANFEVARPTEVEPGDSVSVSLHPTSGILTYHVKIFGQSYSIERNLPLGQKIEFNVGPGIEAYVLTSASSQVNVSGPVSNTDKNLYWSGQNVERVNFQVSKSVARGSEIVVSAPIKINIQTGLNLDLIVIEQNLGQLDIGTLSAKPTIIERIPIKFLPPPVPLPIGIEWIALLIAIVIIAGFVIAMIKKKKKSREDILQPLITTHAIPSEPTTRDLKKELETKQQEISKKLKEIKKAEESAKVFHKSTIIGKKGWFAFSTELKQGDKISGKIFANGHFYFYLTDREHMQKFMKKKSRYYMEFYREGKSGSDFTHDFSFTSNQNGKYLLVAVNNAKKSITVKLDYFIESSE